MQATFSMIETLTKIRNELANIYPKNEIEGIIRIIFEDLKGWSPVDIVLHHDYILSDFIKEKVAKILHRLRLHEPIQYIVGESRFFGYTIHVTPDTLIPRQETEELVEIIIQENKDKDLRVLDIGTGSGCIAIALSMHLNFPIVKGIDNSPEAIRVASANATRIKSSAKFECSDIFSIKPQPESFDIIVSNPPYIGESEKIDMEANVLDYEPHTALFVPDHDPLIYYKQISDFAIVSLSSNGSLYFEINPLHSNEIHELLSNKGFYDINLIKDIQHRNRFATAKKQ